jgi:hypothetical protein
MAVTPLPAATLNITTLLTTPAALPAAEATTLTGATGFSFANNGATVLRVVMGAAGTGTLSFLFQRGVLGQLIGTALFTTSALANNGVYLFGPFQPSIYNDVNGLVQCTMSVFTGNTAGIYFLPGAVT